MCATAERGSPGAGHGAAGDVLHCHEILQLEGLDCADCALKLERRLTGLSGVAAASVSFPAGRLGVDYDCSRLRLEDIRREIRLLGYEARTEFEARQEASTALTRPFLLRHPRALLTAVSLAFLVAGSLSWLLASSAGESTFVARLLLAAAIVSGGVYVVRNGVVSLVRARTADMNVLMTVAVIGAVAIGEWVEAALVVGLFGLGESLEGWAVDKSGRSVRGLMELAPEVAVLVEAGSERTVPVGEVEPGALIAVKPGGRVPLDAVVLKGESALDESALTGEFLPVRKAKGDLLLAGSMNGEGYVEARVTSPSGATTLDRVTRLVQEAQAAKAPAQRFVDRFARYYTPAVMTVALLTAVLPPLLVAAPFGEWLYKGLALLILACPCALVISTPVAIVSALSAASRHGVLVKGGAHLEAAAAAEVVAFDKTGTLTRGSPVLRETRVFDGAERHEVLALAASVERGSEHPLAQALVEAARAEKLALREVTESRSIPGRGAVGTIGGVQYRVGAWEFLQEESTGGAASTGAAEAERAVSRVGAAEAYQSFAAQGLTFVGIAASGRICGAFALADDVRPGAHETVAGLKALGVQKTLLLTGDRSPAAGLLAAALGVDEPRAGLLPEDKAEAIQELKAAGKTVIMVGDGVNDAPALAVATVGVAMGGARNDVALETADITLMNDDLTKVPYVLGLARRTLAVVRQNIGFALALKAVAAALVFPGILTLWMAVLVDTLGSLLVIGNGLRLMGHAPGTYGAAAQAPPPQASLSKVTTQE